MSEDVVGFIYRIDYIGENEIIKGLSYAGSKTTTAKHKWQSYFGSPSKKNCEKCETWKLESKRNTQDFKKEIILYVKEGESLIQNEINYMKEVSCDIRKDPKWLNFAIPRLKGFPECKFTKKQRKAIHEKAQDTIFKKTGKRYGNFIDIEKRRQTTLKRYGVDHYGKLESTKKKNSEHKKQYFGKMTKSQKLEHGQKSLKNRNPKNVAEGSKKGAITRNNFTQEHKDEIQLKRKTIWKETVSNRSEEKQKILNKIYSESSYLYNKFWYVTIQYIKTGIIESKFMADWRSLGFGFALIANRLKQNDTEPCYSRTAKVHIRVLKGIKVSRDEVSRNPEVYG
jgi:hypothetical protein